MKIVCDNCSTKYSIADEKVRGKVFKIKCKKCSHIIVVKGQDVSGEGQPAGFDQKETRVFDYSGFDGANRDAPAADPIWHLVIDREQVGPLTVTELQQKYKANEIDGETYAWREGWEEWKRIAAIEELKGVLRASEAAGGARPESLFGAGAVPSTDVSAKADPTDLFASAGTSMDDEAGELFGGGRGAAQPQVTYGAQAASPTALGASPAAAEKPARRPQKEEQPLFSMAAAEAGGQGFSSEPAGSAKGDIRPMTAQRNENSVLFSLNNLAALASGAADPNPPRSSVGAGFGSSGPDGSGLIDIRAMAEMTMGASKKEHGGPRLRASDDDLPVFSSSSFSTPASAVLQPHLRPANNRLLYLLVGVFMFLILVVVAVFGILFLRRPTASTSPELPAPVASVPSAAPGAKPGTPPLAAAPLATAPPAATPPAATPPAATPPAATPHAATPPAATPPAATPPHAATPPAATPPAHEPTRNPRRPEHVAERPAPTPTPGPEPPRPTPVEPPPVRTADPPKPLAPQKCDEVACLVTPDLPCCPRRGQSGPPKPAPDASLPDKLDQADIIAGMKNVNSRVMGCNDKARGAGAFKVKVTVAADGSVTSAAASPPVATTGAAGCVEAAVRGAHFKKTKQAITFNYPYTFR